jgi:hypothetical protein
MKLALVIICSVLLAAGAPLLLAQAQLPCAKKPLPVCRLHGCKMPCCQEKQTSDLPSAPVTPAPSSGQNTLLLLVPNALSWTPPAKSPHSISSFFASSSIAVSAPLFALNCARLI